MKKIQILPVIMLISSAFFFYAYRLESAAPFIGDLARDLVDIHAISQGDIRLIGPKLSFGGIYAAPWYYYLFVPVYLLFGRSFQAVLYFNALIHAFTLMAIFWLLLRKWGTGKSLLFVLAVGLLPLYVFSARNPGNAFTYKPFLVLWFVYYFSRNKLKPVDYVVGGLWAGLIASFHVINVFVFLPVWLYTLAKKRWREALISLVSFALPFLPLALFELTHGFVMIKNTFIDQSYLMFTENRNIPDRAASPKNLWQNLVFIHGQLAAWTVFGPLVYLLATAVASLKNRRWQLAGWGAAVYLTFVLISRYQFAVHYLLPLGLTVFVLFLLSVIKHKYFYPVLAALLLMEILGLTKTQYAANPNSFHSTQAVVQKVIAQASFDKQSFNVVDIDATGRSSIGNQYRYFFQSGNIPPKNEYEYAASQSLLVFAPSSYSKISLKKLDNYEIRQYGSGLIDSAVVIQVAGKKVFILNRQPATF